MEQGQFGQNDQKMYENYKKTFLKTVGGNMGGGESNFLGSGGIEFILNKPGSTHKNTCWKC